MSISAPFIRRPVATTLLMIGLLLAGLVAYRELAVSALPQVDYPTIVISTYLPGASSETMASAVTTPLERQFGQIPALTQMTSVSSFGWSQVTLQFNLDRSIDAAEQDVQAAINAASNLLPRTLPAPPVYSKSNPADAPILTLAISSETLPLEKVDDYADSILAQKISQVSGVGLVTLGGGQKPAVRVQVDPAALAGASLTMEDVRLAIVAANVNQPKGNIDGPRQDFTLQTDDQLTEAKQFEPIILAYRNGAPIRLREVAKVTDGVENNQLAGWAGDHRAIILNVQRQPGANIIQVADRVKALLPQLSSSLPQGMKVEILTDRTETVRASVRDVQFTLVLTICLVVMVIFVFLRNWRATLIPALAVPLSLVGTFGVMYFLGYSLNNLSLMALTISTGFVVDDAIVMIENIARYIEEGESPFEAALKGAKQIGFTIVSLTVSLIAVLIPLLFMQGLIGRLFREFAVTLAAAIAVSAVLSLTLTPMMCAHLLKEERKEGRIYQWSERVWERIIAGYDVGVRWVLRHQPLTLFLTIATVALTAWLAVIVPKGFFPQQDTGLVLGVTEAAPDVSFTRMIDLQRAAADIVRKDPDVVSVSSFIGADGQNATSNSGRFSIALKPKEERKEGRLYQWSERVWERIIAGYDVGVRWVLRHQPLTLFLTIATVALTAWLALIVPKGFFPQQDTGLVLGVTEAAPDVSFTRMIDLQRAAADIVRTDPDVVSVSSFIGADGQNATSNSGRFSIALKPKEERTAEVGAIIARLQPELAKIAGLSVYLQPVQDLTIESRASRTQYQYTLEDADPEELRTFAPRLLEELRKLPELRNVASDQGAGGRKITVVIDRDTASRLGVSPQQIDDVLYDAFGQRQISTIFTQLNQYRVILEVKPEYQNSPAALAQVFVKATGGTSIPLSSFARFEETSAPVAIAHQGQFPVVTLSFDTAPGVSLGDAVEAIGKASVRLEPPPGIHADFQGTAQAFRASLASEPLLILAALLTVYIVLGVLYESYIHPVTILSTLPSAGVGAFLALLVCRVEFTIIALIGIVLLIGIVKKNAIMMIDFALEAERDRGLTPEAAIHEACLLRFRPIMMTTMAALLGGLPLAIETGTGAELRRPLGITIVGGLLISQVLTLYTTPVVYLYMERLSRLLRGQKVVPVANEAPAP